MDTGQASLDPEMEAFLARTEVLFPPGAATLTVAEQRRIYDEMSAAFRQPRPAGVSVRDISDPGVTCRLYEAGTPFVNVLYCHGGGFILGGLDSHDDICAEIASQTGYRVVSVDYRLAPEHPHPAAFDDGCAALGWLHRAHTGPIVVAGDSAGGNLAAALSHHARGRFERVVGQLLIYPGLGGDPDQGSYIEHLEAPGLSREDVLYYSDIRAGGTAPQGDATFAPLQDKDFSGLPPTAIFTADLDPLRDDGPVYAACIRDAGGQAHCVNAPGLIHGHLRARHMSRRAGATFSQILDTFQCLGEETWPFD